MYDDSMMKYEYLSVLAQHPLLVLALAYLSYHIASSCRAYWRLRHIGGPPLAAWTSLWWVYVAMSRKAHLYMFDANQKYGSLARIGPTTVVTDDVELMRAMNSARSSFSKSDWFKAFRFDADRENLFSETDEEKHHRLRQKLAAGYSGKDNPNLEPDIDAQIMQCVHLFENKYISTAQRTIPLDFAITMQYLTLDIITSLSLGRPFGWLRDEEDKYLYVTTAAQNMPIMNFMSAVPLLSRLMRLPALQRLMLPTIKDRVGMGKIKAVAREMVAERFAPIESGRRTTRNDMTQSFVSRGLSQAEIADESLLQILAGSDTSATIIRSAFVYIVANTRVYTRLQSECRAASVARTEIISYARALELPFLTACIKETLRYHPAGIGLLFRTVGPAGFTHNGTYIPPGTDVGVNAWSMQRHNPVYGSDAAIFRPERWLEAGAAQLGAMERAHEMLFSYGRYKCMGERIARIELWKIVFELARRFDFEFVDPMSPLEVDDNVGLWTQRGMWLRVEQSG